MTDVLIAHAAEDHARAEALGEALKARGFDVALGGDARAAKAVLALWSEPALANAEVKQAAAQARERGTLANARIAPVEALYAPAIDLTAWPGPEGEAAFERLVQALAALRGRPATAAATRVRDAPPIRRILLGAALAAVAVLAALALFTPALRPKAPAPPAPPMKPQTEIVEPPTEFTDSPGATEMFGLTEAEIRAREPREVIVLALERTAIETIEAEAARNDALGLSLLCLAQTYGEGLPQDSSGARRSCTRASAAGDGLATYMLSTFARENAPAGEENTEADRLLARAASADDPRAQTELAQSHLAAGKTEDALPLARRAAAQGYAPAQELVEQIGSRQSAVDSRNAEDKR